MYAPLYLQFIKLKNGICVIFEMLIPLHLIFQYFIKLGSGI